MKKEKVSSAVIRRLPRYYRHLSALQRAGVGLTASQIRQDLSCFGEFGQQGYGYNVEKLRGELSDILGMNCGHTAVVLGAGNLGRALIENFHFELSGFRLSAAFDVDSAIVGTSISAVPVLHVDTLEEYLRGHSIDVVVLTIPQAVAQETANRLMELGVRGFWNFTNIELSSTDPDVKFENIHFADSLLTLSYRIANR